MIKINRYFIRIAIAGVAAMSCHFMFAGSMPTAFTYQGRLHDAGQPANGAYDFEFRLADAPSNSVPFATNPLFVVPVSNGVFAVQLDFGSGYFNGDARWLEIGVRAAGDTNYTTLWPRTALTPAPYALYSERAGQAQSAVQAESVQWNNIQGIPPTVLNGTNAGSYTAGPGLSLDVANQFSVDFGGAGFSDLAARADHTHFGQVWSGTNGIAGLDVRNTLSWGSSLIGRQGSALGLPFTVTAGVYGHATDGDGVVGTSGFRGIWGYATSSNAENYGVYGNSPSPIGYGVYGRASAKTGRAIGMAGVSDSVIGTGVRGEALAESGTNYGGYFVNNGAKGAAMYAHAKSSTAGHFQTTNSANHYPALLAQTKGTASAGEFAVQNTNSSAPAMRAVTVGDGPAVEGFSTGGGRAAYFEANANNESSVAVYNNGTGAALYARNNGSGPALELDGGAIRVKGAGLNTPTPAFIHTVTAANLYPDYNNRSTINHPLCNGDPNAILIVTPRLTPFMGITLAPVSALYDSTNNRWSLYVWYEDELPLGAQYSVLVIKP